MCPPKTPHILCAAPAGFNPSRLPRLNGGPKIKSNSNSNSNGNGSRNRDRDRGSKEQEQKQRTTFALALCAFACCFCLLLLLLGPPLRRSGDGGYNPLGRRARRAAFSDGTWVSRIKAKHCFAPANGQTPEAFAPVLGAKRASAARKFPPATCTRRARRQGRA
jgi:hypothetical protein